ncbi:MAG: acetate/propionate family kinase [Bacteroidia bacterium]|nr:acetate/propionate family kinase [Bacteroidia bacterium]
MVYLVLNSGSSSLKAQLIDVPSGKRLAELNVERIADAPTATYSDGTTEQLPETGHTAAIAATLPKLLALAGNPTLAGVGHRVAHGGPDYHDPVVVTDAIEAKIAELSALAPLHNPVNLAGIRAAREALPGVAHVAVFDTAFHAALPARAREYALPKALREKYQLRRYGFHGTSHQYVAQQAASYLKTDLRQLKVISCHLGNGASVCAIEFGRSVETSMGFTPVEGLIMGTRAGDVDPGALVHLMRAEGLGADQLDALLNKQSGLLGLGGAADMRDLETRAAEGDTAAQAAIHVWAHRVRKYIGAYAAVLGGFDALIFTAGIGENSAAARHHIAQNLGFLGAQLDEDRNRQARLTDATPVIDIAAPFSRARILVVATDEELAIARQAHKLLAETVAVNTLPAIPIGVSQRHAHFRQATLDALFGPGYQLRERKPLSQPGQFAAEETVTIVGPKHQIENVRILGPTRPVDQIEISRTDEFFLGIDAPVRDSGNVAGSPGIKVVGPHGTVELTEGVICAWRHIHMHPEDAARFGVADKDVVDVEVEDPVRPLTFGNVLIRVSEKFRLEMHIDTDEANAAELNTGDTAALSETGKTARLIRKRV